MSSDGIISVITIISSVSEPHDTRQRRAAVVQFCPNIVSKSRPYKIQPKSLSQQAVGNNGRGGGGRWLKGGRDNSDSRAGGLGQPWAMLQQQELTKMLSLILANEMLSDP